MLGLHGLGMGEVRWVIQKVAHTTRYDSIAFLARTHIPCTKAKAGRLKKLRLICDGIQRYLQSI